MNHKNNGLLQANLKGHNGVLRGLAQGLYIIQNRV